MPTSAELTDLVRAVATSADRLAFAALFRHFAPRIKTYLVRSGANEAQSEELVQETMVILWRRAATFDPARAQVSTWIFTIARNVRISQARRLAVGVPTVAEGDVADGWDCDLLAADQVLAPDEQLHASRREEGVRRALESLPPEQAAVLRMSYFDERPHSQIAQELGLPLGTVKSRIRLAVTQLRRLLDGLES